MQRRAAALYAAFFIVIAAASYSLIATAQTPTVQFENPAYELAEGDEFTAGGQTYTVSSVSAEMEGGGHGSPASLVRSGEFTWTNDSARLTVTWDNGSTVTYEGQERLVAVPSAEDPQGFELREVIDREAILANDTNADNETVTRDGTEYVVVTENGTSRLVPADDYFPTPESTVYTEGQTIQYEGNESTISSVTSEAVTIAWTGSRTNTIGVGDEANVTVGGQQYLASFPNNDTLVLTQDYESYESQQASIASFQVHKNGLWGVSILSATAAVFLIGLAYLPSRY
jgi:hypothetical protein